MHIDSKIILVPVDFEKPSLRAVDYAAKRAKKFGKEVLLIYVIETPGLWSQFFTSGDYLVKMTDQVKEKLLELASGIENDVPGIKVDTRVERGKPYEKILEVSAEVDAGMIILGENHQCGNKEDELGTTVYHVTLKSKVPVLTLKGSIRKMKDRIVVPLDLTRETREKMSAALYYGQEYGAKIFLVSVLVGGIAKEQSRIFKKLKEAKETLEMNGVACEMKLFDRSEAPPFMKVLEYAKEVDAGMILLMTHREGYTYDNYIGAFAHHIMNLSKISVLSITSLSNSFNFSLFFETVIDPMGVFTQKKK